MALMLNYYVIAILHFNVYEYAKEYYTSLLFNKHLAQINNSIGY